MNEIIKLKKNHPCPASNAVGKMLDHYLSTTHFVIQQNETQLAEDEKKIKDLTLVLSAAKEKLNMDKIVLQDKTRQLDAESQKLKELEAEKSRIDENNYILERKYRKLKINKPNPKDQEILDRGQKKLNLYKQLTRIRWDYGAMNEVTKGLVTDKMSYIRTFCYPNDMGSRELSDRLWQEIELSTENKSDDDDEEKGNNSKNI